MSFDILHSASSRWPFSLTACAIRDECLQFDGPDNDNFSLLKVKILWREYISCINAVTGTGTDLSLQYFC